MPYYNRFTNIQFLDNYAVGCCLDLFRIDGADVDDVIVAGNVFAQSYHSVVCKKREGE
jgi:hypothetical protein